MIHVFTQPGCTPCKQALRMIEESGVDFKVWDITTNPDARETVRFLGAQGTPVIVTDNLSTVIIGFLAPAQVKLRELIETESAPSIYGKGTWLH